MIRRQCDSLTYGQWKAQAVRHRGASNERHTDAQATREAHRGTGNERHKEAQAMRDTEMHRQ